MPHPHARRGLTPDDIALVGEGAPDVAAEAIEVVYDWDLHTDEITWGSTYGRLEGLPFVGAVSTGIGYAEHLAAESESSRYEAVMAPGGCDIGNGVPFTTVYGLVESKRSKTSPVWVEDRGRWFADANDRPWRVHGAIRIVTLSYEAERRKTAAAQRDPATGAYTRLHFLDHVERHLSLAARKTSTFALVLIGVESLGSSEPVDDTRIAGAVMRLRAQMRSHEVLARYAGTKFAVLLENCNEAHAAAAAERFQAVIAEQVPGAAPLGARFGAVLAPFHGRTPQALMQFAEEALEIARQPTSPDFVLYEPERMRVIGRGSVDTPDEILAALNDNRIRLALQPVVDARTRAVVFYEALVRIQRPDGELIMPDALVPNAEKNGLVALIDRRVIELAFTLLTADRKLSLSINASVASLGDPGWFEQLRTACRLRPDAARRLTVEITETCAMADVDAVEVTLAAIRPLGVKIAIDDFGSGHSSFRNLRRLPTDYLKIDGAFAQNLANSSDDRFFIRTLIELARNLDVPTVAEWVEDEATAKILTEWGVVYLQGHLFGKAELAVMPGRMYRDRR